MSVSGLAALLVLGSGGVLMIASRSGGAQQRLVEQRLGVLVNTNVVDPVRPRLQAAIAAGRLDILMLRAEFEMRRFIWGLGTAAAVASGTGFIFGGAVWAAAGGVGALAAATLFLRIRINRRRAAVEAGLPAFIDRLCQQLLIGASLSQALQRAILNSSPAVRWVFAPAERRLQLGEPLVETLEWAAQRHGGVDLAALATVVGAAMRFGGRLSETLRGLASLMRDRQRIARELEAATAEVRTSSLVLALLPPLVAAGLAFLSPGFLDYFSDPAQGQGTLYLAGGLYVTGLLLLRQIARPRF